MKLLQAALFCVLASASPAEEETGAIAWYGTWEQGLAEAKRLDLPILLHSAAPRCGGVPGMW
ncbi:MAG: hypothetical protein MK291_12205 [Planctomycetes bacterium]|nr:hypothetical protein [Planctomycetota bacterium]